MADNAFVKIGTALLKHQVKKLVGEETLGVLSEELADIGGDKLDAWLGDKSTIAEIEKAATTVRDMFRGKVSDDEVEQWMVMLPIHDLPAVLSAIEDLPTSPDESKLENALRETIAQNWRKLSPEQVDNAVNSFLTCLRSALLPIEKQTLMVIGRSVLRTEEKIDQLTRLVAQLKAYSTEAQAESRFGNIHVGGNVDRSVFVNGNNNVVYYYAGGEKREMRTGWFFGHRYGDLESFTGRATEMDMLNKWLNNDKDNLLMIRALGGFGKSALAWTWFNRVDREQWQTAVWWSFYEKESGFESFLSETLKHLGVEVKESARQQVNDLLEAMHGTNILIVLDGFERLLRQYGRMDAALQSDDEDADIDPSQRDCASPLTETFLRGLSGAGMRSKVLMTTRLTPRVLESTDGKLLKGCRDELLSALSPDDAVTYFHKAGIAATRAEITAVCSAYGYHPLSLSLLIGLINADHENRGDIVVARNLDIFGDIKARRHHVLERAYQSLAPERRDLLSKISCFRGSMEYAVLKKVFPSPDLDKVLLDLRKRGLLQYAGETQRYDMHPIVRHYAYDHFTDEKQRKEAHVQLAMHFIDAMPMTNKNVKTLEDLAPVIELYYHMVKAGEYGKAYQLLTTRLVPNPLHFQFGAYRLIIELEQELFVDYEYKTPNLKNESELIWLYSSLANSYSMSGQPHQALPLFEQQIKLQEQDKNKNVISFAVGLGNVAFMAETHIGNLRSAEFHLRQSIALCKEVGDDRYEFTMSLELGHLLTYCGDWDESKKLFEAAENVSKKYGVNQTNFGTMVYGYHALQALLMMRDLSHSKTINQKLAIENAHRAMILVNEHAKLARPIERDFILAHWILGIAYRIGGQLDLAEQHLSDALTRDRNINLVEMEANILLDLARLRYDQKNYEEAKSLADEALLITERCGYVLQGADVNLFLAQYALEQEQDKVKAKEYAEEAKKLATCDGPPYYYKVAYDEAERMLEKLKNEK